MKKKLEKFSQIKLQHKIKIPHHYKVILLNDDFTSMEFVVKILIMFLNKSKNEATNLMLKIHHESSAVCGAYPKDIAYTIQYKIHNYSKVNHQPLKCIIKH